MKEKEIKVSRALFGSTVQQKDSGCKEDRASLFPNSDYDAAAADVVSQHY